MTTLLDLAKSKLKIHDVPTSGLPLEDLVEIAGRFDEIRKMILGEPVDITGQLIFERAPKAIAAIIAGGTGNLGKKDFEAAAARLPLVVQMDFLEAVLKETVGPGGPGPFADRFAAMMGSMSKPEPAAAPQAEAPKASLTASQVRSTKSFKRGESTKL